MKTPALTAAIMLSLLTLPASAKPDKGKNPGKGNGPNKEKAEKHEKKEKQEKFEKQEKHEKFEKDHKHGYADDDRFNDDELSQILKLFRGPDGRQQLPPGLAMNAKRGKPLPPGWQKKLARGSRVDDDLWNILTPVSYDMFPGIRRTPNTRLYYHENRLIRVMDATREILDVISLD